MGDCYIESNIKQFIFGGKADFTIKNTNSNNGYNYHVRDNKEHDTWFVEVKVAGTYNYAGFIKKDNDGNYVYTRGKKGSLNPDSDPIKGLMWVLRNAERMNPIIKVVHHGRCSVCGRPLTDEMSIQRGVGPTCYERIMRRMY